MWYRDNFLDFIPFDNSLVDECLLSSGRIDIISISSPTAINCQLGCKDYDCAFNIIVFCYNILTLCLLFNTPFFLVSKVMKLLPQLANSVAINFPKYYGINTISFFETRQQTLIHSSSTYVPYTNCNIFRPTTKYIIIVLKNIKTNNIFLWPIKRNTYYNLHFRMLIIFL